MKVNREILIEETGNEISTRSLAEIFANMILNLKDEDETEAA